MELHNYLSELYERFTFNFLFSDIPNDVFNRYEKFTIRHHSTTDLLGLMSLLYGRVTGNYVPLNYLGYEKLLVDGVGFSYLGLHQLYKNREHVKKILKNLPNHMKNKVKNKIFRHH